MTPVTVPQSLVNKYDTLWARNGKNMKRLHDQGHFSGVYVLCDGSMSVYIGRGNLWQRIKRHRFSKSRKSEFWDHFSWYAVSDPRLEADMEALLLRMLPFYLRSLNKQRSQFANAERVEEGNPVADVIERPHFIRT